MLPIKAGSIKTGHVRRVCTPSICSEPHNIVTSAKRDRASTNASMGAATAIVYGTSKFSHSVAFKDECVPLLNSYFIKVTGH